MVIVGKMIRLDSVWEGDDGDEKIYSYGTLRVVRGILGNHQDGSKLDVRVRGGQIDNIKVIGSHVPQFELGAYYLLIYQQASDEKFPSIRSYFRVKYEIMEVLPDAIAIRRVWEATCAANPDGIYLDDLDVKIVVPPSVSRSEFRALEKRIEVSRQSQQ